MLFRSGETGKIGEKIISDAVTVDNLDNNPHSLGGIDQLFFLAILDRLRIENLRIHFADRGLKLDEAFLLGPLIRDDDRFVDAVDGRAVAVFEKARRADDKRAAVDFADNPAERVGQVPGQRPFLEALMKERVAVPSFLIGKKARIVDVEEVIRC